MGDRGDSNLQIDRFSDTLLNALVLIYNVYFTLLPRVELLISRFATFGVSFKWPPSYMFSDWSFYFCQLLYALFMFFYNWNRLKISSAFSYTVYVRYMRKDISDIYLLYRYKYADLTKRIHKLPDKVATSVDTIIFKQANCLEFQEIMKYGS